MAHVGAPETTGELRGFMVMHPDYLSSRAYGDKEVIPKIADLRTNKAVTVMQEGRADRGACRRCRRPSGCRSTRALDGF